MRIGLLNCDDVEDRFRHIAGGYPEMFEALLKPALPELSLQCFEVCQGELPTSATACGAFLCSGSRHSVYEGRQWIDPLAAFVRELARTRTPFVGICFGHQILAQALGGRVARAPAGWGVGVQEMTIVAPQAWMQPPLERCRLQYMHADQVEQLPEGGTLLGRAPHCPVAMFSAGSSMLGIQGHPEFPAAYARALLEERKERIGAPASEALRSADQTADQTTVARWIAQFLGQAVRRSAPSACP